MANEKIVIFHHDERGAAVHWSEMGELVRCKNCKHGYRFYDVQKGITDSWVECRNPCGLNRDVPEDGYCYCGGRKEE